MYTVLIRWMSSLFVSKRLLAGESMAWTDAGKQHVNSASAAGILRVYTCSTECIPINVNNVLYTFSWVPLGYSCMNYRYVQG